ncbi:MAG: Gldg family protein [Promethearchaeota archaeon]
MGEITIGLDYSHNNILTLEATSYSEFTQFLFASGYKLGKIQAGFDSLEKLKQYNCIIVSSPKNSFLSLEEIDILVEYVKNGGGLLITSSKGADLANQTNLSELTQRFGFEFVQDEIFDSVNYINLQKRPLLTKFKPHIITEQIKKIVFSSACSLKILDFVKDEKDIKIDQVVKTGLNSWRKRFDGEEWIEEDSPNIPLVVTVEYYKGKVVSFGNLSIFSSLGREYGFTAFENDTLIANVLRWLSTDIDTQDKVITINLNIDLFYWADSIVKKENWDSISDLINVSLKYFKDNYKKIIQDFKRKKVKKVEKKFEYEKARKAGITERAEDKVINLIPTRDKKDLVEIMKALEELTGEKYELSIDLEEDSEAEKQEVNVKIESINGNGIGYTAEDIEQFERESLKKAIWHNKATKAFEEWLKKEKT